MERLYSDNVFIYICMSKAQQASCHTACTGCKNRVKQLSLSLFVRKCTNISKKKSKYMHVCIVHDMCFKLPTVQLRPSRQWNKASLPDVYQPKPRTPRFFPGQSSTYNLYSRILIIFHEKKKNNALHTQLNTQNRKTRTPVQLLRPTSWQLDISNYIDISCIPISQIHVQSTFHFFQHIEMFPILS